MKFDHVVSGDRLESRCEIGRWHVEESDLVATDHVRRHYTGETYYVLQNRSHRWFYLSDQRPEEVLVFKNFDSEDVAATCE
jgi:hypothetical protein